LLEDDFKKGTKGIVLTSHLVESKDNKIRMLFVIILESFDSPGNVSQSRVDEILSELIFI